MELVGHDFQSNQNLSNVRACKILNCNKIKIFHQFKFNFETQQQNFVDNLKKIKKKLKKNLSEKLQMVNIFITAVFADIAEALKCKLLCKNDRKLKTQSSCVCFIINDNHVAIKIN